MIAVDTNVLVRLLTRDDDDQARRAQALFDASSPTDGALFVLDIVLAEVCWTLERSYNRSRNDIARTIRALLDNSTLRLESAAAVEAALMLFEAGNSGFPDCLIVTKARQAGCISTVTFDRRMGGLPGIKML